MDLADFVNLAYAILGIGIIIFIHELGHFLAAKRVGVRVETFSLGFDPVIAGRRLRLLSFRRGDTVYAIGAIPFGGYVKMAGETSLDRKDSGPPASDELVGKPPGARALVFAAGAVFNIASAFLFFILAFRVGVNFTAPVVGHVEPGRPAWEAGLRPGDRVARIDGEPINDFHEIAIQSALGDPDRARMFEVERDGRELPPVPIVPRWTPEWGFHTVGVRPAEDPEIKRVKEGSPAAGAGIREGDRVIGARVEGFELQGPSSLLSLEDYLTLRPAAAFQIGINREGQDRWLAIESRPEPRDPPRPVLGVTPGAAAVEATRPGSPARDRFRTGDCVRSLGGKPVHAMDWVSCLLTVGREGQVEVVVESIRGEPRAFTAPAEELIRWSLGRDVKWAAEGCRISAVAPGSPFAGQLRKGDLVVAVGPEPVPVFSPEDVRSEIARAPEAVHIWRRRDGRTEAAQAAVPPAARSDAGIELDSMPPVTVAPGSPAARAGIPSGARIAEIDGRRLRNWGELQEAVRKGDPGRSAHVAWIAPGADAETRTVVELTPSARPMELGITLSLLQNRVKAGTLQSIALGSKRTVVVAEHVFLTLKGLIRREVSASNLAGPVGIIHLIKRVSEEGLGTLVYYLALISVNLGLFNLLPFPILDGGHLLFLMIEKVKGSPVNLRIQEITTTVAFFLIIGLALFVTYNDLMRLFGF